MAHSIAFAWLALLFLEVAMPPRKQQTRPVSARHMACLDTLHPDAAGIDIGSDFHVVAVPPDANGIIEVRSFGACTADLIELADWFAQCGVKTAAMESTGVYWIPLYDLLESRGVEVLLVDPRQINRAPGRPKTDVQDAQWIRRLHSLGLLCSAFRPDESTRVLRSYLRHRANLVRYTSGHIQHMQKALEQMNVKLTEAVSDITGKTGMSILKAILAGERDPARLAALRDPRCKQDQEQIARALQGTWRQEHLFELKQAVELYEFYHRQMDACDQQIEAHLQTMADPQASAPPPPRKPRRRKKKANDPAFDARDRLYRMLQVDLTAIEGIEASTALVLISEIGTNMEKWPTVKHFCSWLGVCPQVRQSAGKILSSKVRPGPNRAALALRLAANTLQSSKSALGAFFRRIAARAGRAKAVTATAHKLARLVYALLKHGQEYVAKGEQEYEDQYKARMLRTLSRKAEELGYDLKPREVGEAKS
jgi:transposase